jgi:hypothetical protein
VRIERMELGSDPAARYRGRAVSTSWEGDALREELRRRTAAIDARKDATMQHLRAMMVYSTDDPRRDLVYPTYAWFGDPANKQTPLKPTL